jgi:hypothetical protein
MIYETVINASKIIAKVFISSYICIEIIRKLRI